MSEWMSVASWWPGSAGQCDPVIGRPLHSILRHALDKIAEIKSLLEERRIGEDGAPCRCLPLGEGAAGG